MIHDSAWISYNTRSLLKRQIWVKNTLRLPVVAQKHLLSVRLAAPR